MARDFGIADSVPFRDETKMPDPYSSFINSGMTPPAGPFGSGSSGSPMVPLTDFLGGGGAMGNYFAYLMQALPNILNGIRAGTIQPGQQLQNFQGPQAFGLPGPSGGAGGGNQLSMIMPLLQLLFSGGR